MSYDKTVQALASTSSNCKTFAYFSISRMNIRDAHLTASFAHAIAVRTVHGTGRSLGALVTRGGAAHTCCTAIQVSLIAVLAAYRTGDLTVTNTQQCSNEKTTLEYTVVLASTPFT